jgi:O-glycosyl hydrolase
MGAKVIGSTWSPPANCKSNGSTQRGGYLLESCYGSWSDTIANFAQQQGLYAMSIGNESDFASCAATGPPCTDDYDTTTFTAKQMVGWVKVAGPKLRAKNVKVIAPEASEWIHAWSNLSATGSLVSSHPHSSDPLKCGCYSNTIGSTTACAQTCLDGNGYDYGHWLWADQTAWGAFDIFGVHEYDSQIAYAWPADVNAGVRNKEVWQTEMSGVRYWPEEGPSTTIQNGIAVAGWIHSALTVGEASAWLWWWYEAYYQNDNEGLAITQGSSTTAKRYFTLGNYSKFVRPGYVAVDVVGNSNANVLISAYKGTDGTVVVVAVNKGTAAVTVPISITGGTAPAMMTPTVTSMTQNLVATTAVPVSGGSFSASLAGTTVTTFVGK